MWFFAPAGGNDGALGVTVVISRAASCIHNHVIPQTAVTAIFQNRPPCRANRFVIASLQILLCEGSYMRRVELVIGVLVVGVLSAQTGGQITGECKYQSATLVPDATITV